MHTLRKNLIEEDLQIEGKFILSKHRYFCNEGEYFTFEIWKFSNTSPFTGCRVKTFREHVKTYKTLSRAQKAFDKLVNK